ncbi:MAG: hypothetical protein V1772_08505, partial [Chloroflexota bacterium]
MAQRSHRLLLPLSRIAHRQAERLWALVGNVQMTLLGLGVLAALLVWPVLLRPVQPSPAAAAEALGPWAPLRTAQGWLAALLVQLDAAPEWLLRALRGGLAAVAGLMLLLLLSWWAPGWSRPPRGVAVRWTVLLPVPPDTAWASVERAVAAARLIIT